MNFKIGRFFHLATSFILGTFFFVIGVFSFILPWSPRLKTAVVDFILQHTLILSLFGMGFVMAGLSIILYAWLQSRHHYTEIRTGAYAVAIDQKVIQQYLDSYWEKRFPQAQISFSVTFKKEEIKIIADLPPLPLDEQKVFLEEVKHDFADLFGQTLGYPGNVHLIASFK